MQKNVAILGATGLVGQRFIKMLEKHPYFNLQLLIASPLHDGKKYEKEVHWIIDGKMPEEARDLELRAFDIHLFKREKIDLVFSALPEDAAKDQENELRKNGFFVFSNSSAYRMEKDVPIVIPEVNKEHMDLIDIQRKKHGGFIIANSNCTTSGLVMALSPLKEFVIENVIVTSYQAISGAGYPGISALDINGNVIPYIKNEEEKVKNESRKILGTYQNGNIAEYNMGIIANCARVPVRDGHLESIVVRLGKNIEIEELKSKMKNMKGLEGLPTAPAKPVIVMEEEDRPQIILDLYKGNKVRAKGMSIAVGRIKKFEDYYRFFLLVHNTIRGAAGNAILNAEYALKRGYV